MTHIDLLLPVCSLSRIKAAQSSRAFYVRAIKRMWTQLVVIIISAIGQIAASGLFVLNYASRSTPALLYATLVRVYEPSFLHGFLALHGTTSWLLFRAKKGQRTFTLSMDDRELQIDCKSQTELTSGVSPPTSFPLRVSTTILREKRPYSLYPSGAQCHFCVLF